MVAADGEGIPITAEHEDMEVRPHHRDARGKRRGASVEEVHAVRVDEVREAGRAADAGDAGDLLVRQLQLFHHFEIDGENAEVATARTPRWMVGDQVLFRVLRAVGQLDFLSW